MSFNNNRRRAAVCDDCNNSTNSLRLNTLNRDFEEIYAIGKVTPFLGKYLEESIDELYHQIIIIGKNFEDFDDDDFLEQILRRLKVDERLRSHYPVSDRQRKRDEKKEFLRTYGKLFFRIIDEGEVNLSLVGQELGLSPTTVSKYISILNDKFKIGASVQDLRGKRSIEAASLVKTLFYNNRAFWTSEQRQNNHLPRWTNEQRTQIAQYLFENYNLLGRAPPEEWHPQYLEKFYAVIDIVPMILDNGTIEDSQDYPSLTEIADSVPLDYATIVKISKSLRGDHRRHFSVAGERNVMKSPNTRDKLRDTLRRKREKYLSIATFVRTYYYEDKAFWNEEQIARGYIGDWTPEQLNIIFLRVRALFYSMLSPMEIIDVRDFAQMVIRLVPWLLDKYLGYLSISEMSRKTGLNKEPIQYIGERLLGNEYSKKYFVGGRVRTELRADGYPPIFWDEDFRRRNRLFQTVTIIDNDTLKQDPNGVFRDLWTGEPITADDVSHFHHIDYIKSNMGYLLNSNHSKLSGRAGYRPFDPFLDEIMKLLKNNLRDIEKGLIPESWKPYLKTETTLLKWL